MQFSGIIRITSSLLLVLSITVGMFFNWHPFIIYSAYGLSYLLSGLLGILLVLKYIKIPIRCSFHKGLFDQLLSFTVTGLLFVILPQLGPILLENTYPLPKLDFLQLLIVSLRRFSSCLLLLLALFIRSFSDITIVTI